MKSTVPTAGKPAKQGGAAETGAVTALTAALTAAEAESYWIESRQPLASLLFIAPLLAVYELGVLAFGAEAARTGADVWLRYLLEHIGLGQYFLLPGLTIGALLAWHYLTGRPWRVGRGTLAGMSVECAGLAILLWLLLQAQGLVFESLAPPPAELGRVARAAVAYLGAGIYEELLFRLVLFSAIAWLLAQVGFSAAGAAAAAAVLGSLVFAAAHHVGPYGDPLEVFAFTFRFLAGLFFSTLFAVRGFGIAVGAHAGYDLLVGLV